MGTLYSADEFVNKLLDIANNHKSLYILGCFGAPMNRKNKTRYENNNEYNKKRKSIIESASLDTFGFDCVGMVKAIAWGWCGDVSKTYGGATYTANGVPDVGAKGMLDTCCKDVSTDFSNIRKGEFLWMNGHCGVYIGEGLAVECTPKWDNKVQFSGVLNVNGNFKNHNRTWTKHGKLNFIDYTIKGNTSEAAHSNGTTNDSIIRYTVKKGDTLWSIAKTLLGKGTRYKEIIELNGLKSSKITPNMVLKIPKKGW